jgi:hypothetical protein
MSDNYTQLKEDHDGLIKHLKELSETDFQTKTDLVRKLIVVSRPLIKSGLITGLKSKDLATYINAVLIENGIKYVRNEQFYNLFLENEKIQYGTNIKSHNMRSHEHNFVGDEYEKICECGDIIRLGKHYTIKELPVDEEIETTHYNIKSEQEQKDKKQVDPYDNISTEMMIRQAYLCKSMATLLEEQVKKYYRYPKIKQVIDGLYTSNNSEQAKKTIEDVKSAEAKMILADKQQDIRQKIGQFEKVMAYILEETTYNTAKVAKLINITPKHLTNNVTPDVKKILDEFNWFKVLSIAIPNDMKKGELFAINIADWFDHMLVRKNLSLEFREPILKRHYSAFW